jgi:hypothetical protein
MNRGIWLALAQVLLLLSIAAQLLYDRVRLPRTWVRTTPYDPSTPLRGRYVRLALEVKLETKEGNSASMMPCRLKAGHNELICLPGASGNKYWAIPGNPPRLQDPVAFFLPEHVPDPSLRSEGEELWAEVTVPETALPRPIRLGVKKDGRIEPLNLR